MRIQLSEHFTYKKLLILTFPSIVMLVFTSIYGVVDGFFVSNYVGKAAFTAVNFIMPFLLVVGSVGFMFGTGGGALIAKTLGEGQSAKANRLFSMVVYTSIVCGVVLAVLGLLLLRPLAYYSQFPYQLGTTLWAALLARLFGTGHHFFAFEVCNALFAAVLTWFLLGITQLLTESRAALIAGAALCIATFPTALLSTFIYGTLASAACCAGSGKKSRAPKPAPDSELGHHNL